MQQVFPVLAHDARTTRVRDDADLPSRHPASARADVPSVTRPMSIVAPRRLGSSDLVVFPLALGGSVFGWTATADDSMRILDRFTGQGGNLIDTADSYAAGRSELILGQWMQSRGTRDRVVVATRIGKNPDNPGLSPGNIRRAVDASLQRLRTDRIDVLSFHDEDPSTPLDDSLAAIDELVTAGKVRYLAASNFSAERLIEARILSSAGLPKFVIMQTHYNLVQRAPFEGDLRVVASAQELAVMPYAALAGGYLTGKYRHKAAASGSARQTQAQEYVGRKGNRILAVLDRIAREHESTPASIALAWLAAKRMVVAPVASARTLDQVDVLMSSAEIRLTRTQMLDLDRVSE